VPTTDEDDDSVGQSDDGDDGDDNDDDDDGGSAVKQPRGHDGALHDGSATSQPSTEKPSRADASGDDDPPRRVLVDVPVPPSRVRTLDGAIEEPAATEGLPSVVIVGGAVGGAVLVLAGAGVGGWFLFQALAPPGGTVTLTPR
jgi:hypothetical protein